MARRIMIVLALMGFCRYTFSDEVRKFVIFNADFKQSMAGRDLSYHPRVKLSMFDEDNVIINQMEARIKEPVYLDDIPERTAYFRIDPCASRMPELGCYASENIPYDPKKTTYTVAVEALEPYPISFRILLNDGSPYANKRISIYSEIDMAWKPNDLMLSESDGMLRFYGYQGYSYHLSLNQKSGSDLITHTTPNVTVSSASEKTEPYIMKLPKERLATISIYIMLDGKKTPCYSLKSINIGNGKSSSNYYIQDGKVIISLLEERWQSSKSILFSLPGGDVARSLKIISGETTTISDSLTQHEVLLKYKEKPLSISVQTTDKDTHEAIESIVYYKEQKAPQFYRTKSGQAREFEPGTYKLVLYAPHYNLKTIDSLQVSASNSGAMTYQLEKAQSAKGRVMGYDKDKPAYVYFTYADVQKMLPENIEVSPADGSFTYYFDPSHKPVIVVKQKEMVRRVIPISKEIATQELKVSLDKGMQVKGRVPMDLRLSVKQSGKKTSLAEEKMKDLIFIIPDVGFIPVAFSRISEKGEFEISISPGTYDVVLKCLSGGVILQKGIQVTKDSLDIRTPAIQDTKNIDFKLIPMNEIMDSY